MLSEVTTKPCIINDDSAEVSDTFLNYFHAEIMTCTHGITHSNRHVPGNTKYVQTKGVRNTYSIKHMFFVVPSKFNVLQITLVVDSNTYLSILCRSDRTLIRYETT